VLRNNDSGFSYSPNGYYFGGKNHFISHGGKFGTDAAGNLVMKRGYAGHFVGTSAGQA
jgi:hypothetical protein